MKTTRNICFIALFTALLCIVSPFSIPIGPISITFATLMVYIIGALLDYRKAPIVVLLYIIIGLIGVPVFSNFQGGPSVIMGPTGGYILGYILCVVLESILLTRFKNIKWLYPVTMLGGTILIYLFGTIWFLVYMNGSYTLGKALMVCVVPFLWVDLIKIVLASTVSIVIRPRLDKFLIVSNDDNNEE